MTKLIVALDIAEKNTALKVAKELSPILDWCKVGLELFSIAGPNILQDLKKLGYNVFLDLKFYDIPNTVSRAVKACTHMGANILTVHCQGGNKMCIEAVNAATQMQEQGYDKPLIFGVTVLTSFGKGEMPGILKQPMSFALDLAKMAQDCRLDGIVCSGQELDTIRNNTQNLLFLCPGIRPKSSSIGDQKRVVTPYEATQKGANFLVVGRPITEAQDPCKAAENILAEINSAL